jgi:THAP domain
VLSLAKSDSISVLPSNFSSKMVKCVIKSCDNDQDLFCCPDDKQKLRKWKSILKNPGLTADDLICAAHFDSKFLGTEKFLTPNAFPTLLLNEEHQKETTKKCSVCFIEFSAFHPKHPLQTTETVNSRFAKNTGFQVREN